MASDLPAFKPRLLLDDLPDEILLRVWKQYFSGLKVMVKYGNEQLVGLNTSCLISKKHATMAHEQMLKYATIKLNRVWDAGVLLYRRADLPHIRRLELKCCEFHGFDFALIDEVFRALSRLKHLVIVCQQHRRCEVDLTCVDIEDFYAKEVLADTGEAKQLLTKAFEHHWSALCGLEDITEGNAFTGRAKPPQTHVYFQHCLEDNKYKEYKPPALTYCVDTRTLHGTVNGHRFTAQQQYPLFQPRMTDGRRLCDSSVVEKTMLQVLEDILGRHLLPRELHDCFGGYEQARLDSIYSWPCCQSSNSHEDWRRDKSPSNILHLELCHALLYMYLSDIADESCAAVVEWLERRMTPTLELNTLSRVEALFERGPGPVIGSRASILKECWRLREGKGPVKTVLELWHLIIPALTDNAHDIKPDRPSSNMRSLWWELFQLLYLQDPQALWEWEEDWRDQSGIYDFSDPSDDEDGIDEDEGGIDEDEDGIDEGEDGIDEDEDGIDENEDSSGDDGNDSDEDEDGSDTGNDDTSSDDASDQEQSSDLEEGDNEFEGDNFSTDIRASGPNATMQWGAWTFYRTR